MACNIFLRAMCLGVCAGGLILLAGGSARASENERYKAIPVAGGGYVFIIDTREGHMWTWNSAAVGQASPSGANPKVVYQGNVRQNMKASGEPGNPPVPPSARRGRR